MSNRSATETIKGYFYQFDYSILAILNGSNETDLFTVEGIEDLDILSANDKTAIQCKYFSATEYNHSVIAKPIRLMLDNFIESKRSGKNSINYCLYGHFKSGQTKLKFPITLEFLKQRFLTYKEGKVQKKHHDILGATDEELIEFISLLRIDINAHDYQQQQKKILTLLQGRFNCSAFEAEHYYYNNALKVIKEIAIEKEVNKRAVSKRRFIELIDKKQVLFNAWYIKYKGLKAHLKELKDEYFTGLNTSPFDRFFLIELDLPNYKKANLKDLLFKISKNWRSISTRANPTFCPYVYLHNMPAEKLLELKEELVDEGCLLADGHNYHNSRFRVETILMPPAKSNPISIKVLNNLDNLDETLNKSIRTKEIYQFFLTEPFYNNESDNIKHVRIQIDKLEHIKHIV